MAGVVNPPNPKKRHIKAGIRKRPQVPGFAEGLMPMGAGEGRFVFLVLYEM